MSKVKLVEEAIKLQAEIKKSEARVKEIKAKYSASQRFFSFLWSFSQRGCHAQHIEPQCLPTSGAGFRQ